MCTCRKGRQLSRDARATFLPRLHHAAFCVCAQPQSNYFVHHHSLNSFQIKKISAIDADSAMPAPLLHLPITALPITPPTTPPLGPLPINPHPFSYLNELVQCGTLDTMIYTDLGAEGNLWRARVSISQDATQQSWDSVAAASTKSAAKKLAAEAVLEAFQGLEVAPQG